MSEKDLYPEHVQYSENINTVLKYLLILWESYIIYFDHFCLNSPLKRPRSIHTSLIPKTSHDLFLATHRLQLVLPMYS